MKVTINHKRIAQALNYASKAVSTKPNIPVLSNVLLKADDNGLHLSATNLDMGISMWIPCQVEEKGEITVSAKFIADFVSVASGETVELVLNKNVVDVKTKTSEATFNTIAAKEFPVLPSISEEKSFSINAHDFIVSMNKVLFSCSTDLSAGKIQLSGVLFDVDTEKSTVDFVGLDSFRLSKRTVPIQDLKKENLKDEIIVSARYLQELVRILQDHENVERLDVFLSKNKSQIIFSFDDVEFSVRLLEGPYPDYKRILPDDFSYTFEIPKGDFEQAVKVVNTFARSNLGNKTFLDVNLEKSEITLKANVSDVGENETSVHVEKIDGPSDLNTAYNLRYLQDLVSHVTGKTIIFETKGQLAATLFKDKADKDYLHLIMPLRRDV